MHSDRLFHLYHIRDPEKSAGIGYDGYIGITNSPARRNLQHFNALRAGSHPNKKLQEAYDNSNFGLTMYHVTSGPKDEILARERLFVPRMNFHLNKQVGGGVSRGMDTLDAITKISRSHKSQTSATSEEAASTKEPKSSIWRSGGAAPAVRMGPVVGLALGLAAVSGGAAYTLNKTVYKDDSGLDDIERKSRSSARAGTYAGATIGTIGTMYAVSAAGTVSGLSAVGIGAGVTALGAGSVIAGSVVVVASPVLITAGVGYLTYRVAKAFF